uniref:Uncharacterized protein n=1 Tax=Anguilla anguilla TaxID=7936 RepID=A0A0E9WTJ5_ANGAN
MSVLIASELFTNYNLEKKRNRQLQVFFLATSHRRRWLLC